MSSQRLHDPQFFLIPTHYEAKGVDLGKDDCTIVCRVEIRPPQIFVKDIQRLEPEETTDERRTAVS